MVTYKDKYPVPTEIKFEYDRALRLREQNEQIGARNIFLGLLDQYPEEPRLLFSIANTYLTDGREIEKAEAYYLEALQYAPDFLPALSNLGSLYSRLGRFEEAAEYARRTMRIDAGSAAPWLVLGLYYVRKGEIETGLDYFRAGYSRGDDKIRCGFNIGCALTDLGRFTEALEYLAEAIVTQNAFDRAKTDPTLDPLRELPEFKRIMSEAEQRLNG